MDTTQNTIQHINQSLKNIIMFLICAVATADGNYDRGKEAKGGRGGKMRTIFKVKVTHRRLISE